MFIYTLCDDVCYQVANDLWLTRTIISNDRSLKLSKHNIIKLKTNYAVTKTFGSLTKDIGCVQDSTRLVTSEVPQATNGYSVPNISSATRRIIMARFGLPIYFLA